MSNGLTVEVLNKDLLNKDLYIKLNNVIADHIKGFSIPYFTDERKIYIFSSYDNALKAEEGLNKVLNDKINESKPDKGNLVKAYEVKGLTYIGKINSTQHAKESKDPFEVVSTLDNILSNAKFLGIETVVMDKDSDNEKEINIDMILNIIGVTNPQPRLLLTEEENKKIKEAHESGKETEVNIQLRFNHMRILDYRNPFSISKEKSENLLELLFDDNAENLVKEIENRNLEYNELAHLVYIIDTEYVPMAVDMENKDLEENFKSYKETILEYTASKMAADIKDSKEFFLILLPYEEDGEQKLAVQRDKDGKIPILYTDLFAGNNVNPFCSISGLETFKQFFNKEKPTEIQLSAGPIGTITIPAELIVKNLD